MPDVSGEASGTAETAAAPRHRATLLLIFGIVGFSVAFMIAAGYLADPWWFVAFRSDDSPVSWLSSALLFACAAVALKVTLDGRLPPWVGAVLTLALLEMSLDEQFMFHERFKYLIAPVIARGHPGMAGWLGRLPMLAVAVGGVAFCIVLTRALRQRRTIVLFWIAVCAGVFALWINLGHPPRLLLLLEEGFEVLAESLFLCALLDLSSPRPQVQSSLSS